MRTTKLQHYFTILLLFLGGLFMACTNEAQQEVEGIARLLRDIASETAKALLLDASPPTNAPPGSSELPVFTGQAPNPEEPEQDLFYGITFHTGVFVVTGFYGSIYYSPEGTNWFPIVEKMGRNRLNDLTFGNGYFVAVGDNRSIYYSRNRQTWNVAARQNTADLEDLQSVAFGRGRFVAVGENGAIYYSDHPGYWIKAGGTRGGALLYGVAYGNDRFVAVGQNGAVFYADDGRDWTATSVQVENEILRDIAYGAVNDDNAHFVAVGQTGAIYYSADGETWENTDPVQAPLYEVAYGAGLFLVAGQGGIIYSSDTGGRTWTQSAQNGRSEQLYGLAYGNLEGGGRFVAVGSEQALYYSDDNGLTWQTN